MRKLYPAIPADAKDDEVVTRYKQAFASDMSDEDFYTKLGDTYAKGWEPSVKEPDMNLLEQGQAVLPQVPGMAKDMALATVPFLGAAGAQALTKVPGVGQGLMAATSGVKMLGQHMAGTSLEKTAQAMPQPDVASLRAKGYSPAQIQNVLRGYSQVQSELYGEMGQIGKEGVETGAEAIANAALFGATGKTLSKVGEGLTARGLGKAGMKSLTGQVAGQATGHVVSGAGLGAGFGAIQQATERMAEAKEKGLGANDILTEGMGGAWQGAKEGALVGGVAGGVLGVPLAGITTTMGAMQTASAARKAAAQTAIDNARKVNLQRFADEFKPHQLPERFPEDLAAAAGDDAVLAQNLVSGVWGPEVASSEDGMRAASRVYEKIVAWRGTRDRISGSMIDLPVPKVEPGPSLTPTLTPEQQMMGLQPTAQSPLPPGQQVVPPVPGLEPVASGPVAAGGPGPQPNVVDTYQPTPMMQPVPPPQVPQMPEVQPVGAAIPEQVPAPVAIEPLPPIAPPAEGTPGPPLGPVETGGQPIAPEPEINPKVLHLPTHAEHAIEKLGPQENISLTVGPDGRTLRVEKLGVTAGTLAKPGASSKAIANVSAIADEAGLSVEARVIPQAGPRGGEIPLDKLVPWYEQHGFKVVERGEDFAVVRREPSLGAVMKRIENLDPLQAETAAGNVTLGQPLVKAEFGTKLTQFLEKQAEAARTRIKDRGVRLGAGLDPTELADHAIVVAAEMFTKGMRTKSAVSRWLVETYGEHIQPHIDAIYERAQKRLTTMFKTEARAATKLKELTALRDAGKHGADWYEETANWVRKEFGPEDSDMFLRFLALTSADSSTEAGAALALKAFGQWKQGLPFDGMRGPHMVKMAESAVRGEDFGSNKIQSFYRALRGDEDAVVLDRWMIRALGLPASTTALKGANYGLYERIVRNLAADANMTPRQLQAAIWEGARVGDLHNRWKKGGPKAVSKVGSARPLEQLLQREFDGMTPYQWVERNRIRLDDLANMSEGMKVAKEQGGYSFNPKTWKADERPGFVVTLASDVVPRQEFYPAALTKFKNQFRRILADESGLNIGVFDMGENKPGHFSVDLNMIIPDGPGAREKAIALGKMNRQFQVGRISPEGFEGIDTGYNPKKHGPQYLPPQSGQDRTKWFRAAEQRARQLLDSVSFKLTPKE